MIYAVIDTNVFVSAFSATARIFRYLFQRKIIALYNEEILAEYEEVLSRKKFNLPKKDIYDLLYFIKNYGVHESRMTYEQELPDKSARVFLEITLSREEPFLVTGNLKHYPKLLQVVTPSEFIARFF